jgi:hypothetical protein
MGGGYRGIGRILRTFRSLDIARIGRTWPAPWFGHCWINWLVDAVYLQFMADNAVNVAVDMVVCSVNKDGNMENDARLGTARKNI